MGPAGDFRGVATGKNPVVAAVSIGLQVAGKACQPSGRAVALAVGSVVVHRVRVRLISQVAPDAALAALLLAR